MNWIDAVVLVAVAVSAIRGYILGLSGSILNSLAVILAWVSAFLLAAPVKNLLEWIFGVVTRLATVFQPYITSIPIAPNTPVTDAITYAKLPEWLGNFFARLADKNYTVNTISELYGYWIANVIIVLVVFILLLILFGMLFRVLVQQVKLNLPKEGFFHDFDRACGATLHGLLTLFICLGLLTLFSALFPVQIVEGKNVAAVPGYVYSSFFGGLVYRNFLGVQTMFGALIRFVVGW